MKSMLKTILKKIHPVKASEAEKVDTFEKLALKVTSIKEEFGDFADAYKAIETTLQKPEAHSIQVYDEHEVMNSHIKTLRHKCEDLKPYLYSASG
ncbi:hypothetical protein NDU88_001018 [Pleurodeles waltl]|uniref:Uncharacterized protein n=1 Tax=Pleurodeles waltl TaxID=8319 RepID=A0AAV7UVR0_PLEWA|nr:hypothetical protein NDU88_001018 [Pleurodeles waltl]